LFPLFLRGYDTRSCPIRIKFKSHNIGECYLDNNKKF